MISRTGRRARDASNHVTAPARSMAIGSPHHSTARTRSTDRPDVVERRSNDPLLAVERDDTVGQVAGRFGGRHEIRPLGRRLIEHVEQRTAEQPRSDVHLDGDLVVLLQGHDRLFDVVASTGPMDVVPSLSMRAASEEPITTTTSSPGDGPRLGQGVGARQIGQQDAQVVVVEMKRADLVRRESAEQAAVENGS